MLKQKDLVAIATDFCKQRWLAAHGIYNEESVNLRTARAVLGACVDFMSCRVRDGITKRHEAERIRRDVEAFDRVLRILAPRDKPASGFVALLWNPALHANHEADARRAVAAIQAYRDLCSRVIEDLKFGDAHTGFPYMLGRAFKLENLVAPNADDAIYVYEHLVAAMERDRPGSTDGFTTYAVRDANKINKAIAAGHKAG